MSSTTRLTKYISATTIVTSDVANMWYGGLYGSSEASLYGLTDPLVAGHIHDGIHVDGHAQKIHLVDHVTDQITNPNVGDNAITPRTVNPYVLEENAIPYINTDGEYKLNLSMVTPSMGLGAFIEVPADNLIKHTNEDYSSTGVSFVFGSSSLDDTGVTTAVDEDGDYRFLFDRGTGAFRAGSVSGDQWDSFNRGRWSVGFGALVTASGTASVSIGMSNSALGDYTSIIGGFGNNIASGSDNSVIVGGNSNDIGNSTHCFIAAGHDNQITNSTFSSIIAGCENYNGGTSSAVGGYGVELATGAGSFVWGYDSGIGTEAAVGNQVFIIGTGAIDNDEKYRLGVNTSSPHPVGEMGAHIVGSTDEGSSPLRLENLNNSDSQDALCVDGDGNVFVSDWPLAAMADPGAVVFDPPVYKYKQYTMDVLPISSPYFLDEDHSLARYSPGNYYFAVYNAPPTWMPGASTVHTEGALGIKKSEPGSIYRPSGVDIPYEDEGCNDPANFSRFMRWPVVRMGAPDSDPQHSNNIRWTFPIFDGLRLYRIRVGFAGGVNNTDQEHPNHYNERWRCDIFSLEAETNCPPEDTFAPDGSHYGTDVMPGFISESNTDSGEPCEYASPPGGVVDSATWMHSGDCEYGGGIIQAANFSFTGTNSMGDYVDKPGMHVASLTFEGNINNPESTNYRYVCWVEMIYEVTTLVGALECSSSGGGIL
jgi:hypothetical protein